MPIDAMYGNFLASWVDRPRTDVSTCYEIKYFQSEKGYIRLKNQVKDIVMQSFKRRMEDLQP